MSTPHGLKFSIKINKLILILRKLVVHLFLLFMLYLKLVVVYVLLLYIYLFMY